MSASMNLARTTLGTPPINGLLTGMFFYLGFGIWLIYHGVSQRAAAMSCGQPFDKYAILWGFLFLLKGVVSVSIVSWVGCASERTKMSQGLLTGTIAVLVIMLVLLLSIGAVSWGSSALFSGDLWSRQLKQSSPLCSNDLYMPLAIATIVLWVIFYAPIILGLTAFVLYLIFYDICKKSTIPPGGPDSDAPNVDEETSALLSHSPLGIKNVEADKNA